MQVTVERAGRGLPGIPRQRTRAPQAPRFLEATVVYRDGRVAVEHTERNDAEGRRAMDRWGNAKLLEPQVDYIAVDLVARVAGYERSRMMTHYIVSETWQNGCLTVTCRCGETFTWLDSPNGYDDARASIARMLGDHLMSGYERSR